MQPTVTSKHKLALGVILLLAAVLRIGNYAVLADGPCLIHHRVSDMAFFAEWAGKIADGDVWTDDALHPVHFWHQRCAAIYYARHPSERPRGATDTVATEQLWDGWYGGKTFHQEPLYPYSLALIRAAFGKNPMWVHVAQMLLGIATLLMVWLLTSRLFGGAAGCVATGLAALYAPLVFFELYFLRAAPIAFATLAVAWLCQRTHATPTRRNWLLFGLGIGVAMTLKLHFFAFGLLAAGWLAWSHRADLLRNLGVFGGGLALAVSPVWIRNLVVGAPFLSATSVGPVTIANSNYAGYIGFGWAEDEVAMQSLAAIMPEHGGSTLSALGAAIDTHPTLAGWLDLLWTKFLLAFSWAEFPNNVNQLFAQMHSPWLASLPVTFTVLMALAVAGLVGALATRRLPVPLLLLATLSVAQLVVFYNLGRFRLALVAALLPLAGLGAVWLVNAARARAWKSFSIGAVLAAACVAFVQRPLPEQMQLISAASWGNSLNNYYRPEWRKAEAAKNWTRAAAVMAQAIAVRPENLDGINPRNLPPTRSDFQLVQIYAEVYHLYARALVGLRRNADAEVADRRARELAQTHGIVQKQLQRGR